MKISNLKLGKSLTKLFRKNNIQESVEMQTILESTIPEKDKVKILAELYTFNHGDSGCKPFEYSSNCGNKHNGGGDFRKFKQNLLFLGYDVMVTYHEIHYKLFSAQEEHDARIRDQKPFPSDIQSITITSHDGQEINLFESSYTLEFLALSGDKRAIETYNNFMCKVGASQNIIHVDEYGKPYIKK